jgi:recombination protein RecR
LAFFLLNAKSDYIENFKSSLDDLKSKISKCPICGSLMNAGQESCKICASVIREKNMICVVEEYLDLLTIEQTG